LPKTTIFAHLARHRSQAVLVERYRSIGGRLDGAVVSSVPREKCIPRDDSEMADGQRRA
jgi:hypothetical protein